MLCLFLVSPAGGQVPFKNFEIVESVPLETNLDNPEIRNTLPVWLEMINSARKSISIEQMYLSNKAGEPLEIVIQAILKAAERGVKVRIVAARKFYEVYPETLDRLGKKDNIEVRLLDIPQIKGAGIQHAKFFIIDDREVFIGSQNFDWRAFEHIHEIGIRIRHREMAKALGIIFEIDWQLCEVHDLETARKIVGNYKYPGAFFMRQQGKEPLKFQLVCGPQDLSPNKKLWALRKILYGIRNAKQQVNVELLKYSPVDDQNVYWPEIDVALRMAASRGVNVRMIVSDWCKTPPAIEYLKSLAMVPNIEIKLATIPAHSSGYIPYARVTHAKFMTVDDRWSWVGCSNWQKGYYYESRDVGIVVYHAQFNQILTGIFERDWNSPYTYPLQPQVVYEPPQIGEKN